MERNKIYEFGPFRFDAAAGRLLRDVNAISLTPKVADTLLYMLANPGRILSKEELISAVWEGRRVEEANLTQNISVLRKALAEAADEVKYIATFPGRGYQFLVPVRCQDAPAPHAQAAGRGLLRRPSFWLAAFGTAALAISLFTRIGREAEPVDSRSFPVSRLPGHEYHPAVTPDGQSVAFVWDQDKEEGSAIFVRRRSEDTPRQLAFGAGSYSSPAWSPDGANLAYLRFDGGAATLVITPTRGGADRELARLFPNRYNLTCRHIDWSPDGRWIAVDDKIEDSEPLGIFLIDVETGERRRLTLPAGDLIGDVDPRFSPDGRQVAFVRMTYRYQHDLYVADLAGGAPRSLTADRRQIGGHDWKRDGKAVIYSSDRGGDFRVYEQSLRGAQLRPLGITGYYPIQIATARHADVLVYSEFAQELNLWRLANPRDGRPTKWERIAATTASEVMPQISPDGRRICYRSDRTGDPQLWVAGADGSDPRQITSGAFSPLAGRWSPDGRRIVFGTVTGGAIYVVSAGGGIPQRVPVAAAGSHPMYLPGGEGLLDSIDGLWRVDPATGARSRIDKMTWPNPHGMQASRDGEWVYFVAGRTGDAIWRGSLLTGMAEHVMDGVLRGNWGCWALGRNAIYYLGRQNLQSPPSILRFDLQTGRKQTVAPWPGPLPPIGTSLWSLTPDEGFLYVVRVDRSNSDVTLIEPFI